MSIPFHSRITRQNRSKNEPATPKGSKIPLLGLDAKGHKNPKRTSHEFLAYISRKKELFKLDHQMYGREGGIVWGLHYIVSEPVIEYMCILYIYFNKIYCYQLQI